jgi:hypothetical protein
VRRALGVGLTEEAERGTPRRWPPCVGARGESGVLLILSDVCLILCGVRLKTVNVDLIKENVWLKIVGVDLIKGNV